MFLDIFLVNGHRQKPILKLLQSENKKEFLEICQEITNDRYSEVVNLLCDRGEIITVPLSVVLLSSCEYLKELIKRVHSFFFIRKCNFGLRLGVS